MKFNNSFISKSLISAFTLAMIPSISFAESYKVDTVHSSAVFKIKHNGAANFHGRFNDINGTVNFDSKNPAKSSVMIEIDANTVDTKNTQRDDHLRSPDFLNVKEFPKMTFKSTAVKMINATTYDVNGDFTLHGVTKPIKVRFVKTGEGKGMKGEIRVGGETTFVINRNDYGIKYMPGALGNDVTITLAVEGIKE